LPEQRLEDLAARLERERLDADRRYNDALTALDRAVRVSPDLPRSPDAGRGANVPADPRIMAGARPEIDRSIKGRLRGFIWRLVAPPLQAQADFDAVLVEHLQRRAAETEDLERRVARLADAVRGELEALGAFESRLVQYLQTITLYVDTKVRSAGGTELRDRLALAEDRLLALKRTIERAPSAASPAPQPAAAFEAPVDAASYVAFEDRFRGSQQEIARRLEEYVPMFESASDVVDIGCGRGELLELFNQRGIRARGVDANEAMVEVCRSRGLQAERADALGYLDRQPDGSIGGLIAIQVVEHMEPAYLMRFLETAYHKMKPGAPIVLETINAACWMAFFETYIRDLTHRRPLHPDTLKFLVQAAGFAHVDVQFRQPVAEADRLDRVASGLSGDLEAIAKVVNARMFSSMDYAVVARR